LLPFSGGKTVRIYKLTHTALLALLLGAIGAPGLKAQEGSPLSYVLKIRAGLTAGDIQKTHFDNKIMGFGAEAKWSLFGTGQALKAELAFEFIPGRHHDVYPWADQPRGLNLNPRYSYDNRKEYGQGWSLRVAYSAPMAAFGLDAIGEIAKKTEWFGGLSIDMYKVRSEVKYTLNFTPNTQNPPAGQYDGGTHTVEGNNLTPGVFAGLRYNLNKDFGLELTLRNFGMYHYEFTPAGYYTDDITQYGAGTSTTGTSRGFALEFAVTARF
jgi:hypothetical protein